MADDITVYTVEFAADSIQRYRYNATVTVVTDLIENAVALVKAKYPDAKVHAVHKRSRGEIIVDPKVQLNDGSKGA